MELILPTDITERLKAALEKAGTREIGGVLMGEHTSEEMFRVRDLTIQNYGGSFAAFLRAVEGLIGPLRRYFQATNHEYTRFNYLGEWHSHPSFVPEPSPKDNQTMRDIIEDPQVGANFVVLLIVKLSPSNQLDGTLTIYQPGGVEFKGLLAYEEEKD